MIEYFIGFLSVDALAHYEKYLNCMKMRLAHYNKHVDKYIQLGMYGFICKCVRALHISVDALDALQKNVFIFT